MKLYAILLTIMMIALLLFGCASSNKDAALKEFVLDDIVGGQESAMAENATESGCSPNAADLEKGASERVRAYFSPLDNPLSLQILCSQEQSYSQDKSLVFSTYIETPTLSAHYFKDVENRVNSQIDTFLQKREANVELWRDDAKAYYEESQSEGNLPFYGWSSSMTASVQRMDQNYISLVFFDSTYLGGVHPSNSQAALNFDAVTGAQIPLSAVFDGEKREDVLQLLLSRLQDMERTFSFYPDYASYVSDMFNSMPVELGQNWYLTDTSVVFFFSPEQISPYAAGVVSVELAYDELKDFLRSDFLLPDHSEAGVQPEIFDYSKADHSELPANINIVADLTSGEGAQLAIYAGSEAVYDFRIYTGLVTDNEKVIERTLYAANVLPAGSAVLVDAQKDANSLALGVGYRIAEDAEIQWIK